MPPTLSLKVILIPYWREADKQRRGYDCEGKKSKQIIILWCEIIHLKVSTEDMVSQNGSLFAMRMTGPPQMECLDVGVWDRFVKGVAEDFWVIDELASG